MGRFDDYAGKYSSIHMRRENGILEMRFHTNDGPLRWGLVPHGELPDAFADVARDRDNRVVILTGTGDEWSGVRATPGSSAIAPGITSNAFDRVHWEGRALLMNLLNIEVPVISAINGPAWRHGEIPLLSDIVLASETAQFQDSAHFPNGLVPGDGMHIVMPLLLGINRGRYFLLTGQTLSAAEAKDLGLVAEVLPKDKVLARAWEHAEALNKKPSLLLRYTRLMFTEYLRKRMQDLLGYGLAMEGLALMEQTDRSPS
jgi:enoyl-CoA hydratase/carnithine racemase